MAGYLITSITAHFRLPGPLGHFRSNSTVPSPRIIRTFLDLLTTVLSLDSSLFGLFWRPVRTLIKIISFSRFHSNSFYEFHPFWIKIISIPSMLWDSDVIQSRFRALTFVLASPQISSANKKQNMSDGREGRDRDDRREGLGSGWHGRGWASSRTSGLINFVQW